LNILDLGTNWRWAVSFAARPLYPLEITTSTHYTGGWVQSRACLDSVGKRTLPRWE
jgi:hypothetical protein